MSISLRPLFVYLQEAVLGATHAHTHSHSLPVLYVGKPSVSWVIAGSQDWLLWGREIRVWHSACVCACTSGFSLMQEHLHSAIANNRHTYRYTTKASQTNLCALGSVCLKLCLWVCCVNIAGDFLCLYNQTLFGWLIKREISLCCWGAISATPKST